MTDCSEGILCPGQHNQNAVVKNDTDGIQYITFTCAHVMLQCHAYVIESVSHQQKLMIYLQDARFDTDTTLKSMVELHFEGADMFLGPENTCVFSAKLAASLNKPIIGFVCHYYVNLKLRLQPKMAAKTQLALVKYTKYTKYNAGIKNAL